MVDTRYRTPSPLQFEHGQSLLEQFLYSSQAAEWREPWHMPTPLPDLYSYKVGPTPGGGHLRLPRTWCAPMQRAHRWCCQPLAPTCSQAYWGDPEPGWMGMFSHQVHAPCCSGSTGRPCSARPVSHTSAKPQAPARLASQSLGGSS